jgi:hypothetical protein
MASQNSLLAPFAIGGHSASVVDPDVAFSGALVVAFLASGYGSQNWKDTD